MTGRTPISDENGLRKQIRSSHIVLNGKCALHPCKHWAKRSSFILLKISENYSPIPYFSPLYPYSPYITIFLYDYNIKSNMKMGGVGSRREHCKTGVPWASPIVSPVLKLCAKNFFFPPPFGGDAFRSPFFRTFLQVISSYQQMLITC